MIRELLSMYSLRYPTALTYMLQSTEYQTGPYIKWMHRAGNFNEVMHRRTLDKTKAARLLLLGLRVGIIVQILFGLMLIYLGRYNHLAGGVYFGLAIIVIYPIFWAYAVTIPLVLGRWLIIAPKEKQLITQSEKIFAEHPAIKIAVAGSYGKTTMKELLLTVLSEGKLVAATPANKNVSISHAYFARKLTGNEEIIIIEYGEGQPGDVAHFARITHPTHAVITGLAPAHLDRYKTIQAAGKDIFSVADYLGGEHVYVDDVSSSIKSFVKKTYEVFNTSGALGWQIKNVTVSLNGTDFSLQKAKKAIKLHSDLVGKHQVAFLGFAAAFGLELGLSEKQIKSGIAKTKPFEHRMQPYALSGAWIIDDTYNGNLEGIRVGTGLLKDLKAQRKIYVTPGLVDQGKESERVHIEVGELIAAAQPDLIVLMQNSVTTYIERGLNNVGYTGQVQIENNPLEFYTNLTHFVAAGDLVLMQNDWTDNYA